MLNIFTDSTSLQFVCNCYWLHFICYLLWLLLLFCFSSYYAISVYCISFHPGRGITPLVALPEVSLFTPLKEQQSQGHMLDGLVLGTSWGYIFRLFLIISFEFQWLMLVWLMLICERNTLKWGNVMGILIIHLLWYKWATMSYD